MQLTISRAKLLIFEEQSIVHKRERIIDIEIGLLAVDQGVSHELIETRLQGILVNRRGEPRLCSVVEQVCRPDILMFWMVDY